MEVRLISLVGKLSTNEKMESRIIDQEASIHGVRLADPTGAVDREDLLYVGSAEELSALEKMPKHAFCWGDARPERLPETSNWLHLPLPQKTAVNLLLAALEELTETNRREERLLRAVFSGADLQQLIDLAAELFGNPVLMVDNSYKHLYHSRQVEVDDPVWQEAVKKGYWSYETVVGFKEESIIRRVVESPQPVLIDWGIGEKIRRISTKFEVDGVIVGHVAVLEYQQPFTGNEADLLALLSRIIASELSKPGYAYIVKGMAYESVISDLLDGAIVDGATIGPRLRTFGWEAKSPFRLLLIDTDPYDPSHSLDQVLKQVVETMLERAKPVVYQNQLVVIIEGDRQEKPVKSKLDKLKSFLEKENMRASLSQQFKDLKDTRQFFQQAQALLAVGRKIHPAVSIYPYDHYGVYLMVKALEDSHENISQFCHPALKVLKEFDRMNRTAYYDTLHTFLVHARNTNVAAEEMFIHRNTMAYRLGKIERLTGVDLRDDALLSQLYLSFKVLEYIGQL